MAVSRLARRSKIIIGAVAVLTCLAALASYLYVRYVDVVRFSAEHGRITVDAAPAGTLGTVLVTNKGFVLYMFAPDAARRLGSPRCRAGLAGRPGRPRRSHRRAPAAAARRWRSRRCR